MPHLLIKKQKGKHFFTIYNKSTIFNSSINHTAIKTMLEINNKMTKISGWFAIKICHL